MIRGALLTLVAWLVASVAGLPIDPFLPLVIALALHRDWAPWTRVILAIAIAPLTAAACGDVATERAALYAVVVMGSMNLSDWFDDSVWTRCGYAALALGGTLVARALLAAMDFMPPGAETWPSAAASVGWVAAHSLLLKLGRRGPA